MGKGHPDSPIIALLDGWTRLVADEIQALQQGDLPQLEELLRRTALIQQKLAPVLAQTAPGGLSSEVTVRLRRIHSDQARVLAEMHTGHEHLRQRLGRLRRNKTSLAGYRQAPTAAPRFFNKLT